MAFEFSENERVDLQNLLGNDALSGFYLDAVEFWIEQQLVVNNIDNPTSAIQKSELNEFVKKCDELTSYLDKVSVDTAFLLKIALVTGIVSDDGSRKLFLNPSSFSVEPPYFEDRGSTSRIKSLLERWSALARDLANSIDTRAGPRRKLNRDAFVRRVVQQYRDTFGKWPQRGEGENFHSVVQTFCRLAGFSGETDIEKVIRAAKSQATD